MSAVKNISKVALVAGLAGVAYGLTVTQILGNNPKVTVKHLNTAMYVGFSGAGIAALGVIGLIISRTKK